MYPKLDVDAGRGPIESDVMLAHMPAGERPRERLYWSGPDALADVELLALQLGSGMRGRSAIDVARELLDLGLDELFSGDGVTVVEWADKLLPLLPARTIHVHIEGLGDEARVITIRDPRETAAST